MAENSKIGTAANVVADLQKKVETNAPETTVERTKVPKVKLTDVILKLIADSTYLSAEHKGLLAADIDKVINKVTNAKPSVKGDIRELFINAGPEGISRSEISKVLSAKYPDVDFYDLSMQMFPSMQPANYQPGGHYGWNVKVVTGGNYVWVK